MNAYFCEQTGERITAPGVSKSVDPVNGQDVFSESPNSKPAQAAQEQPAPSRGRSSHSE